MSLQRRLTLYFVIIVFIPLALAGFVVQRVVVSEIGRRAVSSLEPALHGAVSLYNQRVQTLETPVGFAVRRPQFTKLLDDGRRAPIDAFLAQQVGSIEGLDFLAAIDRDGRIVGAAEGPAGFVSGVETPTPQAIVDAGCCAGPGYNTTPRVPVVLPGGERFGWVVGGFWLDSSLLQSPQEGVDLSIVSGGRVIASTMDLSGPAELEPSFAGTFDVDLGGAGKAEAENLTGGMALVASTSSEPIAAVSQRVILLMLGLLAVALVGTVLLAHALARYITRPIDDLLVGARAISEGRFDHRIEVQSKDEVGQLAGAFNDMTDRLRTTITQLYTSRDQFRRAVHRVGETLRSTHDMNQMLDSILQTAADAVQADAASLWRFTPTRDELYPAMSTGVQIDPLARIRLGEGVVGYVAERAGAVFLPSEGGPRLARDEPSFPVSVAIPIYSQDRIMGVLAVHRRDENHPFSKEDLDVVVFLGEQGGVAIENVLLHEETTRLSLTDGLTGVWNRRYFQMQFRQVLATATRFTRPFSLLMLDLDHFKDVNDTYGHQRGDEVLVEFSQRVSEALREVDTFARYGGEEFICLLSETDMDGAKTTAEKIVRAIRSTPFGERSGGALRLTVSIGIASYPEHGDSFGELVDAADRALYRAKQEGRDRVRTAALPPEPPAPGLRIAK
ncbi:MAG TPA: diguanylate cyclase [Actinomycetota bacterium]|jgi:diguanylate cyclase (GGDEF)-like protein